MDDSSAFVAVVDDDPSMRAALDTLLRSAGLRPKTFPSAQDFLRALPSEPPDCVVLDVRLPGKSGLELQAELLEIDPTLSVVFITGFGDIPMSVQAMKNGAVEFLPKPFSDRALLDAVGEASRKTREARHGRDARAETVASYESLTRRERDVLACVARGLPNKLTAHELGISEVTVKIHRGHVMAKMKAASAAELVRMVEQLRAAGKT
ncbi:MAG: response regulator [Polyangiales bacterium]